MNTDQAAARRLTTYFNAIAGCSTVPATI